MNRDAEGWAGVRLTREGYSERRRTRLSALFGGGLDQEREAGEGQIAEAREKVVAARQRIERVAGALRSGRSLTPRRR